MKAASILLCLPLRWCLSPAFNAAPEHPVGSAVQVVNLVTAEFNRDTRTLQRGDRVHQDETIEVGLDGSSELKLDDDTKLALGPGSHLTLDKFVYDPEQGQRVDHARPREGHVPVHDRRGREADLHY